MTDDAPDHPVGSAGRACLPATYPHLLADIKTRIRQARTRAALSVNAELIRLYWGIGGAIVERQRREGWGKGVIEHLSRDLRKVFPGLRGFSAPNLWKMRALYLAYREEDTILSQPVREFTHAEAPPEIVGISWSHNVLLVTRLRAAGERLWYARQTLEHGWSRSVLTHQIDSDLYHRQGQAITNFEATLPPPDSDLAKLLLKDPYAFEFLDAADHMAERKLELRRFVLVDLKTGKFKPENVGKMGFYLTAWTGRCATRRTLPRSGSSCAGSAIASWWSTSSRTSPGRWGSQRTAPCLRKYAGGCRARSSWRGGLRGAFEPQSPTWDHNL